MIRAFIFDVDGVLVDSPHERAWGDTLRMLMESTWSEIAAATRYRPEDYTSEVYQAHVAGRPRTEGAAALLSFFDIPDPDGSRCALLCEEKQKMIVRLIDEGAFRAYDDALRFLLKAKERGALLAAASSSKNANRMMSKVRLDAVSSSLLDVFDANVCGREFRRGKPHPQIFLTAARALDLSPEHCVVVEDAPSGVRAAKAARMKCIGVARMNDEELLKAAGADWVVTSLNDIDPVAVTAA